MNEDLPASELQLPTESYSLLILYYCIKLLIIFATKTSVLAMGGGCCGLAVQCGAYLLDKSGIVPYEKT